MAAGKVTVKELSEREARAVEHEISYAESRREEAAAELLRHMATVATWQDRVAHWERELGALKARSKRAT